MDNSGTKPKMIKETDRKFYFDVDPKWSIVKVRSLKSNSKSEDKAYALNYFLNQRFLANSEVELVTKRADIGAAEFLFKYRPCYNDQTISKYLSYSSSHSILASLVYDLTKAKNESEVITSLRDNVIELKKFAKDDSINKIVFYKNTDYSNRYYKLMLKHLIISDKELYKILDLKSFKETKNTSKTAYEAYTIDKK